MLLLHFRWVSVSCTRLRAWIELTSDARPVWMHRQTIGLNGDEDRGLAAYFTV